MFSLRSEIVKKSIAALGCGVIVVLAMFLLRPTGMMGDTTNFWSFLYWSSLLGGGCTVMIAIHFILLPIIFPRYFDDQNFGFWKQVLMFFLVFFWMTVYVEILDSTFSHRGFSWISFRDKFYYSFLVGLFPVAAVTLGKQWIMLRRYKAGAATIAIPVKEEHPEKLVYSTRTFYLKGENRNEVFECPIEELLFVKAADNYVEIWFVKGEKVQTSLIRSSMKNVLAGINELPTLYRCHRSYIVNLSAVSSVSGNAQGYLLSMTHGEEQVPVSRALNTELRGKLQRGYR